MNISVTVLIPTVGALKDATVLFPPPNLLLIGVGGVNGYRQTGNTLCSVITLVGIIGGNGQFIRYTLFQGDGRFVNVYIVCEYSFGYSKRVAAGIVTKYANLNIIGVSLSKIADNSEIDLSAGSIIVNPCNLIAAAIV